MKDGIKLIILGLIFTLSFAIRFWGLGYSHFYGDETKVLYLDKTIPAYEFFMDQRKGPVQFLAAWLMEKITGNYDELWIRVPFALAGFLNVFLIYFISLKMFKNETVALLGAALYSFSGFNVAFSRTAQYQMFVQFFGLLGIYLYLLKKLTLSGFSFALAFLSHYDALFYILPVAADSVILKTYPIKKITKSFILPIVLTAGIFYLPYLISGNFEQNTLGYLSRRFSGADSILENSSRYTFFLYNPNFYYFALLLSGILGIFYVSEMRTKMFFFIWALIPFAFFELGFQSPGTHVMHYYMALYILAPLFLYSLSSNYGSALVYIVLIIQIVISFYLYVPFFGSKYPWENQKLYRYEFLALDKSYQVFVYGFPYNRGWDTAADTVKSFGRFEGFDTNDNRVVASYYMRPAINIQANFGFYPDVYLNVLNNQEIKTLSEDFLSKYEKKQEILVNGSPAIEVLKLKK